MKKFRRTIVRVLLYVIGIVALFLLTMTIYHHVMLSKEASLINPNRSFVSVDGHKMHVYAEGEKGNKPTLIIMSAYGIAAPVYDYKTLYSKLSDEYRIVVVEKFGYGYSDVSGLPRDISTMAKEDREALKLAGENGPYVLLPHSMSGLEALYWAQHYPDEVSAIVGLDMSVPECYQINPHNLFPIKLLSSPEFLKVMTYMGLHRISIFYPVSERGLTKAEIAQNKYLTYKMTLNDDVIAESRAISSNAKKVQKGGMPNIPMLLFSSNGDSTGLGDKWVQSERNFASQSDKIKLIQLDCGHMIHYYKSDYIVQETKKFLQSDDLK
ncbi:alpha/beta hydrolase [Bacillus sp. 03113]|uniref:alpha/beta hydrolase n=1 Tax=Bacillus sp. 03113 TaxID=2578211 RepID=UPI0011414FD2|nr:alpha/beta hydrolase [Bacillus sp. 03113]